MFLLQFTYGCGRVLVCLRYRRCYFGPARVCACVRVYTRAAPVCARIRVASYHFLRCAVANIASSVNSAGHPLQYRHWLGALFDCFMFLIVFYRIVIKYKPNPLSRVAGVISDVCFVLSSEIIHIHTSRCYFTRIYLICY